MTYQETIDYLYSQLPVFHRTGPAAYKANLDNTIELCNLINNPQNTFKTIHVAGTNGKGSVSHMIAAVLQEAGYKTGLYTSPHLKDFRERIKINGVEIPENYVIDFVAKYKSDFERIKPSFFEMNVALCFDYFGKEKVDIAVIETGLGGRLDSTNIIKPILSVITNISYDHTFLLGNTLEKIASEKAGIIKAGTPVIIGETIPESKTIFEEKAKKEKAPIFFADQLLNFNKVVPGEFLSMDIQCGELVLYPYLNIDLTGLYQLKNILTVIQSLFILREEKIKITDSNIREGLRHVKKLTGLKGRWHILSKKPLTIADTGHNVAGIAEVLKQIDLTSHKNLHFVLGLVNDKDISGILELLPAYASYYFCKADIPRAMDALELAEKGKLYQLKGEVFSSVNAALKAAQKNAGPDDLVFIGGSTFVVAEAI